jgi:hypothetical protein
MRAYMAADARSRDLNEVSAANWERWVGEVRGEEFQATSARRWKEVQSTRR